MAGTRRRRELDAIRSSKHVGRLFKVLNGDESHEAQGWRRFVRELQTMTVGVMHDDPQLAQGPPFVIDARGFGHDLRASIAAMHGRLGLWDIARVHRGDRIRRCGCDQFMFGKRTSCSTACRVARHRLRQRMQHRQRLPGA